MGSCQSNIYQMVNYPVFCVQQVIAPAPACWKNQISTVVIVVMLPVALLCWEWLAADFLFGSFPLILHLWGQWETRNLGAVELWKHVESPSHWVPRVPWTPGLFQGVFAHCFLGVSWRRWCSTLPACLLLLTHGRPWMGWWSCSGICLWLPSRCIQGGAIYDWPAGIPQCIFSTTYPDLACASVRR